VLRRQSSADSCRGGDWRLRRADPACSIILDVPSPSAEALGADPDDEYLIDLVRQERVDALVSGDAHLLDLRHSVPAMTPREFLELLSVT
jgi:predicted nucleic acid-binding protein